MSVFDKKYPTKAMGPLLKVFKWGSYPFQLVGTGGLSVMSYPADIDGLVLVKEFTPRDAYKHTKEILARIVKEPNLFFAELKLQNKDGKTKEKFYSPDEFTAERFFRFFDEDEIDMIKFDCVADFDNHFKEVSCIYFLSNTVLDMNKYQKTLFDDGVHYYDSGKPYKYLKRLFMANKIAQVPNIGLLNKITDFFNSGVGRIYAIQNELDAAYIFHKKYNGKFDNMRLKNFLINVGLKDLDPAEIPNVSEDYNNLIQNEARKFIRANKLLPERQEKELDIGGGEVAESEEQPLTGAGFLKFMTHKPKPAGGSFLHWLKHGWTGHGAAGHGAVMEGGNTTASKWDRYFKGQVSPSEKAKMDEQYKKMNDFAGIKPRAGGNFFIHEPLTARQQYLKLHPKKH